MSRLKLEKIFFDAVINYIRKDKEEGFNILYQHYEKFLHKVALCNCGMKDRVYEVIDDVLVKVWQLILEDKLSDIRNPKGWLYTITANCAKDLLKEERHGYLYENIPDPDNPFDKIIDQLSFEEKMLLLDEEERKIVVLKIEARQKFREIGKDMRLPTSTVFAIFYRGLDKIKKKIEK